jgi:hypothetical protein
VRVPFVTLEAIEAHVNVRSRQHNIARPAAIIAHDYEVGAVSTRGISFQSSLAIGSDRIGSSPHWEHF